MPGRISRMRTKLLGLAVVGAAMVASAATPAGEPAGAPPGTPLVREREGRQHDLLFRLNPHTLEEVGRPLRTFRYSGWQMLSPDGSRLAVADAKDRARVQLIDTASWRSTHVTRLQGRTPLALGWLSADRLLARTAYPVGRQRLSVIDARSGRVVARRTLRGWTMGSYAMPGGQALAVARRGRVGPLRVVLVDASGALRTVVLDRVLAGGEDSEPAGRQLTPGIAVDPGSGRLYVVAARGLLVAEIDPVSGAVTYHSLGASASKGNIDVWWRDAHWAGEGRIAVTGERFPPIGKRRRPRAAVPFGARLIDTRDWTIRTLDPRPNTLQTAGTTLLAHGTRWFPSGRRPERSGLLGFDSAGRRLFSRFRDRDVVICGTRGRLAYVWVRQAKTVHVIDVRNGHTLRRVSERRPPFLVTATP